MKYVRLRRDALPDHPWIYRKQVLQVEPGTRNGDPVRVSVKGGACVGAGLYHRKSRIAVRMLTRDARAKLDRAFLERRLAAAVHLRRGILGLDKRTDAYRVVNSEGDGLSGLIVDRYGSFLVAQIKCLGFFRFAPDVAEILTGHFPGSRIVYRRDLKAEKIEGFRVPDPETPAVVTIRSDALSYGVDLAAGHKTGAFLDQRDNRLLAASVARGRDVLDLFCYEGAFAMACARKGAKRVRAVDLDERALARARENAKQNRLDFAIEHGDAFEVLRARPRADFVLLDPPRWISSSKDDSAGRRRYLDLNRLALAALPPGGLLMTSSCSGRLSSEEFLGILRQAAAQTGRDLNIIEVRGAAPDHPVPVNFPEGRYLTTVLARVG